MLILQMITIKTNDGISRQYSIDEIGNSQYIVSLHEGSIYDGEPAVFNSPDNAFLFMLKIMSWVESKITNITSDCTFLKKQDIQQLCNDDSIAVDYN